MGYWVRSGWFSVFPFIHIRPVSIRSYVACFVSMLVVVHPVGLFGVISLLIDKDLRTYPSRGWLTGERMKIVEHESYLCFW